MNPGIPMPVLLASSVEDAVAALAANPGAAILAGGTDLMVRVNAGAALPGTVVTVGRIAALRRWSADGRVVRLGAALTYRDLLEPSLAELVPALAQAARAVGTPQIRNVGTLGGSLGTASPTSDVLPVLLALGAEIELAGPAGTRVLPIESFVIGPRATAMAPGELITAVTVPRARGPQEYLKVGGRNAATVSIASLAVVVDADLETVGVGVGAVGPVPRRAAAAEDHLRTHLQWSDGRPRMDAGTAERFAALVAGEADAVDDLRASARYRRHAVAVLAERALRRVTGG